MASLCISLSLSSKASSPAFEVVRSHWPVDRIPQRTRDSCFASKRSCGTCNTWNQMFQKEGWTVVTRIVTAKMFVNISVYGCSVVIYALHCSVLRYLSSQLVCGNAWSAFWGAGFWCFCGKASCPCQRRNWSVALVSQCVFAIVPTVSVISLHTLFPQCRREERYGTRKHLLKPLFFSIPVGWPVVMLRFSSSKQLLED